jgi:hypothetical protein
MKPIKIIPANFDAIKAELARVNGRADSFTITSASDVSYVADQTEKRLAILPKADRAGARATYTPGGPGARAYKYEAKSTFIQIERRSAGWYLTAVSATTVSPREDARLSVSITPAQSSEIQRRSVADFRILKAVEEVA